MRNFTLCLLFLGLAGLGLAAGEKILQNDSLTPMGKAVIQKGFIKGDIGAAVLSASPNDYPLKILEAQVFFKDTFGSGSQRIFVLHVYPRGGTNPGTPQYSIGVALREGGLNFLDLRGQNLIMKGPFTLGFEVFDLNVPAEPNLCTDADGCQSGKNLIYDINTRLWYNGCLLGIKGDLVIRAKVDTHHGQSATLSTASTPRIASVVVLDMQANQSAGLAYLAASSFSSTGIPIGTRTLPLGYDPLLLVSLFSPAPVFLNYSGTLDATGKGTALINLPNLQALVGVALHSAFVTLDAGAPQGVKDISNGLALKIVS